MAEDIEKLTDSEPSESAMNAERISIVNEITRRGFVPAGAISRENLERDSPDSYVNQLRKQLARGEIEGYILLSMSGHGNTAAYVYVKPREKELHSS